jgi:hypothetical protein
MCVYLDLAFCKLDLKCLCFKQTTRHTYCAYCYLISYYSFLSSFLILFILVCKIILPLPSLSPNNYKITVNHLSGAIAVIKKSSNHLKRLQLAFIINN